MGGSKKRIGSSTELSKNNHGGGGGERRESGLKTWNRKQTTNASVPQKSNEGTRTRKTTPEKGTRGAGSRAVIGQDDEGKEAGSFMRSLRRTSPRAIGQGACAVCRTRTARGKEGRQPTQRLDECSHARCKGQDEKIRLRTLGGLDPNSKGLKIWIGNKGWKGGEGQNASYHGNSRQKTKTPGKLSDGAESTKFQTLLKNHSRRPKLCNE